VWFFFLTVFGGNIRDGREGELHAISCGTDIVRALESGCLGIQPFVGGKSHPLLNTSERPIAKKYREGKMKWTLRRESKAPETVGREATGAGVPFHRHCSLIVASNSNDG